MQRLVLVGGGHSHAIAILDFINCPLIDTQITLVTDVLQTPYSGMLPGYIAGFYSFRECHIDLCKLAAAANINILVAKALKLDTNNQQVICDNSQVIDYDFLSINIGSTPYISGIAGAVKYGTPVKPIPAFLSAWQELLGLWEECLKRESELTITIVGGGAGGVELALNMQQQLANIYWQQEQLSQQDNSFRQKHFKLGREFDFLNRKLKNKLKINLLHRQLDLLLHSNPRVGKYLQKLLRDRQIQLYLGERVDQVLPRNFNNDSSSYSLCCESGLQISSDRVFWVTNATAPAWLESSGVATNKTGFVTVNNYLQSISHPQIFAAGDIASMVNYQLPKAGVFAVRQGLPLAQNLRLFRQGQTLKPYQPQTNYLSLIGTGDRSAVAVYGKFAIAGIAGNWLWRWKDGIDRKFMSQFES